MLINLNKISFQKRFSYHFSLKWINLLRRLPVATVSDRKKGWYWKELTWIGSAYLTLFAGKLAFFCVHKRSIYSRTWYVKYIYSGMWGQEEIPSRPLPLTSTLSHTDVTNSTQNKVNQKKQSAPPQKKQTKQTSTKNNERWK